MMRQFAKNENISQIRDLILLNGWKYANLSVNKT